MSSFKTRIIFLSLGAFLGLLLGFFLQIIFYLFSLIVLGYGHSAPEDFIKLHRRIDLGLMAGSIIIASIASQWFCNRALKKNKGE